MPQMDSRERRILMASVVELMETMKMAETAHQWNMLNECRMLLEERSERLDNGRFYSGSSNPGTE
jgi:hypothetical protein